MYVSITYYLAVRKGNLLFKISPLLIVYWVALGKDVKCSSRQPEDRPVVSELHFALTRNTSSVNSVPELT